MADYVSNTPISRPRRMPWEVHWDCNGMVWNNDYGFFFNAVDQMEPLERPAKIRGQ
ncbi:hypothetical protein MYRNA_130 [Mycobacterium phage Myrna]|uniref:Uncharacterized protein n=1 Tax=Mycobacterium phage Myrna TaxID=546805 RepID=B5LJD4_9CAUD|nr:gp130 [Mycobacterium phage Myrna]ACH62131.1 hypothetical protein MYRNA_130 [Mycobacterium phage Myrna]